MTSLNVDPNEDFGEDEQKTTEVAVEDEKKVEGPRPKPVDTDRTGERVTTLQRAPMLATDRGLLIGGTLEEQYRLAQYYCKSGLMPRGLDTAEKVLVALQLCRELNLPAITSIGKVMVMNGSPTIHSDLPLALVRRSGLLLSIKESWIKDKDGNIVGAECLVYRKGEEELVLRSFTIEDAKVAQLWGKKSRDGKPSPWILYPTRMLQMRARNWALKDKFGDVLFGVAILEYDHNAVVVDGQLVGGDERDVKDVAAELNDRYLKDGDGGDA